MSAPDHERAERRRPETNDVDDSGAPAWVVTFGDMMSLLLAFFILLLSFSDVDAAKFNEVRGSIREALGVATANETAALPEAEAGGGMATRRLVEHLIADLVPRLRATGVGGVQVEVLEIARGVVLRFSADDLLLPGTAELRPSAGPLIAYLAVEVIAAQESFELAVETRTAEGAPRAPRFEDELALTTAQTITVAQALRAYEGVRPERIRPVGRGLVAPPVGHRAVGAGGTAKPTVEFVFLISVDSAR